MKIVPAQNYNMAAAADGPFSAGASHTTHETHKPVDIHTLPDELLVHILSDVPRELRISIRRVSKKWSRIIRDLGYHIEPVSVSEDGFPDYANAIGMKHNPATLYIGNSPIDWFFPLARGRRFTNADLLRSRSQFITSPPISMVYLSVWKPEVGSKKRTLVHSVVRTAAPALKGSEGVRIGDLMDVIESMKASIVDVYFNIIYRVIREESDDEEGDEAESYDGESDDDLVG